MNDHRSRDEQTKPLKIHSTAMITLAFISFPAVQNMIQFMSLPPSGIQRTHNGLLSNLLD